MYGQLIAVSITSEKSNRAIEVLVNPNMLIKNTTTNIIIIGPTLVDISSVFDTKAPKAPNINE